MARHGGKRRGLDCVPQRAPASAAGFVGGVPGRGREGSERRRWRQGRRVGRMMRLSASGGPGCGGVWRCETNTSGAGGRGNGTAAGLRRRGGGRIGDRDTEKAVLKTGGEIRDGGAPGCAGRERFAWRGQSNPAQRGAGRRHFCRDDDSGPGRQAHFQPDGSSWGGWREHGGAREEDVV